MKYLKYWAAAALLCAVSAVSFWAGRDYEYKYYTQKHYEAACMLSDICRIMVDNIGSEADEIYQEYLDNIYTIPNAKVTSEELKKGYAYCY